MRSSKRAGRVGKLRGTRGLRLLPPWNWRYRPRYHLFTYFAILLPDYEGKSSWIRWIYISSIIQLFFFFFFFFFSLKNIEVWVVDRATSRASSFDKFRREGKLLLKRKREKVFGFYSRSGRDNANSIPPNETTTKLHRRFNDLFWNFPRVYSKYPRTRLLNPPSHPFILLSFKYIQSIHRRRLSRSRNLVYIFPDSLRIQFKFPNCSILPRI